MTKSYIADAFDIIITIGEDFMHRTMVLACTIAVLAAASQTRCQNVEYAGSALWTGAYDLVVEGEYAYCAFKNGLIVLDITDPENPLFVSQFYLQGDGQGVFKQGDYIYFADGGSGLHILDVSTPSEPAWVGGYNSCGATLDLFVSGDYAYMAVRDCGLQIIDVSDPSDPSFVGGWDTWNAVGVYVSGDYAYLADSDSGLQIIDVSDPEAATYVGS